MSHHLVPQRWAEAWSGNPSDENAVRIWENLYSLKAVYTDHAFQIIRQGRQTLGRHWEIWRTANPDFVLTIAQSMPVETLADGRTRYSIRTHNSGTFTGEFPRHKASGKKFYFRAVVDLVVNQEGLIDSVEEWYCPNFDATNGVNEYHFACDEDGSEDKRQKL